MSNQSYLNQVEVNWTVNEKNGYNVPHFVEWMEDEKLILYTVLPVVKVTNELFNHIENTLEHIPEELLKDIEDKAKVKTGYFSSTEKYAFVITNGNVALAVSTNGLKIPMKKSRLSLQDENLVQFKTRSLEAKEYEFKKKQHIYNYLSLEPSVMAGLTRKERHKKQVLFQALDDLKYVAVKNVDKLKYLYGEWSNTPLNQKKQYTYDGLLNKIGEEMKAGWTKNHENVAEFLVKHDEYLSELYHAYDKRIK